MKKHRIPTSAIFAIALFLSVPSWGGTLSIDFQEALLSGSPGATLTFQGTLGNNTGSDLFINGAGINLSGFDPSATDLTDFILNATGPLPNGTSVGPVDFFTVAVPQPFTPGLYLGELTVQGGATADDDAVLGTTDFQVKVNGPAAAPEPGSLPLAAAVFLLVVVFRRRTYAE
jgi:hypothetical protein